MYVTSFSALRLNLRLTAELTHKLPNDRDCFQRWPQVCGKRFDSCFIRRRLLSNGTLYFSTVLHSGTNRPDEGMYQCVATLDGVGTIVSRTAELKVAGEVKFVTDIFAICTLQEPIKN